jgi:hypothetical protein
MIFLFEKYAYSLDYLKKVLPTDKEGRFKGLPNGFVKRDCKLDGVGYLFNGNPVPNSTGKKDVTDRIVFVLPKVFLDEKGTKAFGEGVPNADNFKINAAPKEFLSQLSLWVCSSIGQYRLSHPNDKEVFVPVAPDAHHFNSDKLTPTLIDVMNSMKLFYAENRNLFVFTAKNKHSGNNRIDWRRTVAHTQPFIQGNVPIYMELENKKKVFDLDDRLLVLYFSAMHYIEETFGFKMPQSEFYAPMRVNEFRSLLGHRGLVEMRRIKHKYFADKFLKLYNIVKAFFEWGGNFSANDYSSEYLLTSKYNNVFEAMIDRLVGDDLPNGMKYLKDQKDGKIIDHLYKDRQLIFADENQKIWFIGDSKYYSEGKKIEGSSIYKQFTYAKNIIQYNISELLGNGNGFKGLRYRDELTEGYSVTPNFFIRGFLPESNKEPSKREQQFRESYFRKDISEELIKNEEDSRNYQLVDDNGDSIGSNKGQSLWDLRNRHFENRLFDRDTLLLQVYNVNFLYVLKAYTSKRSSLREEFKSKARKLFRENFLNLLDKKYVFWAVWPKKEKFPEADNYAKAEEMFVNKHFRTLVGKIFRPMDLKCLILALESNFQAPTDSSKCHDEDVFCKISEDCEYFHITPKEIFPIGVTHLPEATFADNEIEKFDEQLYAYSIKRDIFKTKEIGKTHRLPKTINGRKLTGVVLGDCDTKRMKIQKSPLDEYYYLPCKEESSLHSR